MADIADVDSSTMEPSQLLGQGRRHLAVRDYSSAVSSLGKACELLAQLHGQHADQCGEAYFWYGKSLLGLAREESGVLGDGIPQGGEEIQDEDDEDEDDAVDEDNNEETEKNGEDDKKTDDSEIKDIKKEEAMEVCEAKDVVTSNSSSKEEPAADSAVPSTSGEVGEGSDDEEDEVENLQVAWEVLELARDIFIKRGDTSKKDLADVYLHLGEVSLESETYDKAVIDMTKSLELLKELNSPDERRIAETHYQIGLAHSLSNGFEDAVTHFKEAADILEARIKCLEAPAAATEDLNVKKFLASDPFYSIEGEVKELKELLPEIREKIQDMIDYKAEAIRSVRESLGLASSNGAPAVKINGTEEKKISDISHLVRRKRKPSEGEPSEDVSVAKKPAT